MAKLKLWLKILSVPHPLTRVVGSLDINLVTKKNQMKNFSNV